MAESEPPAPCNPRSARLAPFPGFARQFADCWDRGDAKLLDEFVDTTRGFWVVWNAGVFASAYHFPNVSVPFTQRRGTRGFGYLAATKFKCEPSPGEDPGFRNCKGDVTLSKCEFGAGQVPLAKLFENGIEYADRPKDPLERARLRPLSRQAQVLATQFLSDSSFEAMFYFGKQRGRWVLVAVSTADCSG